ncbi:MAG: M20/M25/M40 family metallo-hydrolase, partial [Actinobacteria bacterium]|nr:M20 family metallopeptidase [Actinomycetota bacterium]NIU70213.1 M20 family metallopeptidase [Actinomycetota bacterium]NIV89905.1 M20/M25/M40 family metallo-hydrolase [Actinomycetota bacterium]NIW32099.1 M20/M25/M40 family metallo-hydrolase [Actinomycetota bacterium]NIX24332.1 M20/M25/M40 family metallo-hydrolase [Actinomycetota bacterium]
DVQGLRRMASRLGDELEQFGFESEIDDASGRDDTPQPVLVARRPRTERDYVLLVGHLDTVLPAIAPRRLGDRLDATGALDMKGGLATLVGALERLRVRGIEPGDDLLLVAVPDEEVGGPISERAVREWGRSARTVLVLEPGEARGEAESIVTGRRGLIGWRLRATGQASHSGLGYWEGRSAIGAAATWCGRAQALSEPGEGPIVNVGRILGGDAEFVDDLAEHHALVGTNYRLNIVSDRCVAEGEVRFLSVADG